MIKVEVIENFSLKRFNEIANLERAKQNVAGKLNVGDKFECSKELADYLLGNNPLNKAVVKVIEVKPELPINQTGKEITQNDEKLKTKKTKKNKK